MELQQVIREFDEYLRKMGRRESTRLAYRTDLGDMYRALKQMLGREPTVQDITLERIREYLQTQAERQRRSTLLRRISSLRAFQRYLRDQGLVDWDFLPSSEELRTLMEKSEEGRPTPCLSSEDLKRLWKALIAARTRRGWRDLALVALLVEWGFPTDRLIRLQTDDLDLEGKRIRVRNQGGVEMWFPLQYSLGPLAYYVEKVRYQYHLSEGETHLFISQLGRPLSRQSVWQSLGAWGTMVGFPFSLTPRVLRNTAAFRLWKLGTPRELIQQALGHTNPISTLFLLRRLHQTCGHMPVPRIPLFDPETESLIEDEEAAN